MSIRPIGILDSGVGGLTVLREIRAILPHEPMAYLADSANLPYGSKTDIWIQQRVLHLADQMVNRYDIKTLVVACNTATAAAAGALRGHLSIPVIGMEPAVKPASEATKNGTVGILATEGTIRSARLAGLLKAFADGLHVITRPCPGLVEMIENSEPGSAELRENVEQFLQPLLHQGADTIVLGCTHYPLLRELIRDIVGPDIHLIDTGAAVARQTLRQLTRQGLLGPPVDQTAIRLFTTGPTDVFSGVIQRLFTDLASVPVGHFTE